MDYIPSTGETQQITVGTSYEQHLAKGVGWSGLSVITLIAIAVIMVGVGVFAGALSLKISSFLYKWMLINPLHLSWAIPAAVVFSAISVSTIYWISIYAFKIINRLILTTEYCVNKALEHYRAIRSTSSMREL